MANPAWVKGMKSPNPEGSIPHRDRFKPRSTAAKGLQKKIASYLSKRWNKVVTDIDSLPEKDRVRAYLELLAYSEPKKAAVAPDAISREELDLVYNKIIELTQRN
jgi:hypothetical protein